jgi:divalent metal cation (Fe/Co/Zn/Cd) transporter
VFAADRRVQRVVRLDTQQLGPDELFVGAHVVFDETLSGEGVAHAIDEIVAAVQRAMPEARRVFVQPETAG